MDCECVYPKISLENKDQLVQTSTDTLALIGKLDSSVEAISAILDKKTKHLHNRGERAEDSEKAEVVAVLRALEVIAKCKVNLAIRNYDFIDNNIKVVDMEIGLLEKALRKEGVEIPVLDAASSAAEPARKRRRADDQSTSTTTTSAEPVYCTCKRVAFGDMIACDNEECPVEWFHYSCVNLTRKPRNAWICPLCSNKRKK